MKIIINIIEILLFEAIFVYTRREVSVHENPGGRVTETDVTIALHIMWCYHVNKHKRNQQRHVVLPPKAD